MKDLADIRMRFHQRPELDYTEFWTTAEICRYLESFGFSLILGKDLYVEDLRVNVPHQDVLDKWFQNAVDLGAHVKYLEKMRGGYTGVIGVLDTGRPGPTLAYRADIDALPIQESKDMLHIPARDGWSSKHNGIMHACGHDVHLTMALGVARWVFEHRDSLSGKYIVIFSAAEEGGKGCASLSKLPIINEIQAMMAYHVATLPLGGHNVILPGVHFRSIEQYHVEFHSPRPASQATAGEVVEPEAAGAISLEQMRYIWTMLAAMPDKTNDALNAMFAAVQGLRAIPLRADGHALLQITALFAGADRDGWRTPFSVPPDPCSFNLTIRADTQDSNDYMVAGAKQVLQAAAAMYGVQVDVEKTSHFFPPWKSNSPAMLAHAMGEWKEMGRGEDVIAEPNGQFGTDDVFFLMQQVVRNGGQALYMVLASDDDKGRMRNIHDPEGRFDLAPELMDAGVELATRVLRRMGGSA